MGLLRRTDVSIFVALKGSIRPMSKGGWNYHFEVIRQLRQFTCPLESRWTNNRLSTPNNQSQSGEVSHCFVCMQYRVACSKGFRLQKKQYFLTFERLAHRTFCLG